MVAKIVIFSVVIGMSLAATWRGRLPAKPKELGKFRQLFLLFPPLNTTVITTPFTPLMLLYSPLPF